MPFDDLLGHQAVKTLLRAAIRQERLAHAYLFYGEDGIGKFQTAVILAQALNCEGEEAGPSAGVPDACGRCRSCLQIQARTYPDCLFVAPDPSHATPQIKIDQIREIEQHMVYRPLVGRRKVCLIDNADRMTLSAANALLKTLEEPPGYSVFVLVSARPAALPLTIRSRCQSVRFTPPPAAEVEAALVARRRLSAEEAHFLTVLTEGRIGHALQADLAAIRSREHDFVALVSPRMLASIPGLLAAAEALAKEDRVPDALEWLAGWIRDLVLVQVGVGPETLLHRGRLEELRDHAEGFALEALLSLLGEIETLQRGATRNLNPQLILEHVLLGLREARDGKAA